MAVEHEGEDPKDPKASALVNFGVEVRMERQRHGMSLSRLATAVPCDKSLVQKVETAERTPSRDFAAALDRVFDANGRFVRHWEWAIKYAFPPWFQHYVELERQATSIRMFQPVLVPGLLQSEEYARAVLRVGRHDNLDDLVTMRMERQLILDRETPPKLWVVVDAGVLTRTVGSDEVMQRQLQRLLSLAATPSHVVQVLPYRQTYHGWSAPFSLLSFDVGADVVHVDGHPKGYLLAEPDEVATATKSYDLLKATALPPDESAALINDVLKERYS